MCSYFLFMLLRYFSLHYVFFQESLILELVLGLLLQVGTEIRFETLLRTNIWSPCRQGVKENGHIHLNSSPPVVFNKNFLTGLIVQISTQNTQALENLGEQKHTHALTLVPLLSLLSCKCQLCIAYSQWLSSDVTEKSSNWSFVFCCSS